MTRQFPSSLHSDEVSLRQWRATDVDFYAGYLGDEATARFQGGILDRQQAWRHLASVIGHWSLRGFGPYAVVDRLSQQLQGCAGVWEPESWPCREFVFWFTAEAYKEGRALSAGRLVLQTMRSSLEETVISGFIHPDNLSALELAAQLGGRQQGEAPLFHFGPHICVYYPGVHPLPATLSSLKE